MNGDMSKRQAAGEQEPLPQRSATDSAPKLWIKLVVSAVLVFHLSAVFIAPLAFAADYSSPLVNAIYGVLRPYIAAMYLDHGYFFFAPNPGPSHLIDYKVEFADGRPPLTGRFPDLQTERPRLRYHRHFMLTESLNNRLRYPLTPPAEPTPPALTATAEEKVLYQANRQADERERASWRMTRRQFEAMRDSYAQHLQALHGGSRVTLTRIEHVLPSPVEVRLTGRRLDDSRSYVVQPEPPRLGDAP